MNKSRCISTIKHGEILQLAILLVFGGGGGAGKGSNMFSSLKSDAVVPETLRAQKPIRFPGFLLLPKIWMMMLKKINWHVENWTKKKHVLPIVHVPNWKNGKSYKSQELGTKT